MLTDYEETRAKEQAATDKLQRALWADKRRKIEKIFLKMFGKPIDKMRKV
jgi:hypothetical protein